MPVIESLFEHYWKEPNDQTLAVYADALVEAGDPRGELIQLSLLVSPTQAQQARRADMIKKHGSELVGPARTFLRQWTFGKNGLVELARCEAPKLVEGIDEIGHINPHLTLTITSLKTKPIIERFARTSLERIGYVDFTSITGYSGINGGTPLSDKSLVAIAPALAKVRHVALSCAASFTPVALGELGKHLRALEFLGLVGIGAYRDGPSADEYAAAIGAGFPALKGVYMNRKPKNPPRSGLVTFSRLPSTVLEIRSALK